MAVKVILAHFHHCTLGKVPLRDETAMNEAAKDLDREEQAFLRRTLDIFKHMGKQSQPDLVHACIEINNRSLRIYKTEFYMG